MCVDTDYRRFVELFELAGVKYIEGTSAHGKTITVMNKYGNHTTFTFGYYDEMFLEVS